MTTHFREIKIIREPSGRLRSGRLSNFPAHNPTPGDSGGVDQYAYMTKGNSWLKARYQVPPLSNINFILSASVTVPTVALTPAPATTLNPTAPPIRPPFKPPTTAPTEAPTTGTPSELTSCKPTSPTRATASPPFVACTQNQCLTRYDTRLVKATCDTCSGQCFCAEKKTNRSISCRTLTPSSTATGTSDTESETLITHSTTLTQPGGVIQAPNVDNPLTNIGRASSPSPIKSSTATILLMVCILSLTITYIVWRMRQRRASQPSRQELIEME